MIGAVVWCGGVLLVGLVAIAALEILAEARERRSRDREKSGV